MTKTSNRRTWPRGVPLTISLCGVLALLALPVSSAPAFEQGVADYNGGNYARALGTFQSFKASYPNNALVHYYIALSQQGLGHIDQAKAEYQWVINSRDPKLSAQASAGLAQLSRVRTTGSGGGVQSSPMPTAGAPPGGSVSQKVPQGKIKKVLDFWATW